MSALFYQKGEHVYRRLVASGDLFLPISDRFRDRLISLGAPADRVMVHRMGLNLNLFCPGDLAGTGVKGDFLFLSVGRLVEKKGHQYTIRAFAICRRANPGLAMRLVIIGHGALLPQLRSLAAELGLADEVMFTGGLSRQLVRDYLVAADAFVLPSVTAADGDTEGIPVSIMEAMAMELPVLSTVHSGIPEIVQDGITGFLVPERNEAALAVAMGKLAAAPDVSASMGHAGRRYIAERLDLGFWNDLLVERLTHAVNQAKIPLMAR
jgi:colanic acid/amylovoran biosynthesis glycosyltransferase